MSSRISIIHFGDLGARAYSCGEGDQASLCSPLFLLIFGSSKEKEGKGRGKSKLEEKKSRYGTLSFVS